MLCNFLCGDGVRYLVCVIPLVVSQSATLGEGRSQVVQVVQESESTL